MFVCTLPSPACMCSATNTRRRSTRAWIAFTRAITGAHSEPAKSSSSGPFSSRFHDTTVAWSRSGTNVSSSAIEQALPVRARRGDERARVVALLVDHFLRRALLRVGTPRLQERRAREEALELVAELDLVRDRELDVDPLDAVGVVAEALERDDDVLVDLERVRVPRDRRRARAIEPELAPAFRRNGDEAFAAARVRNAHDLGCRLRDGVVGLADDVCRAAPSSACRAASPSSRSRRPSRNARRGARGRRGSHRAAACRGSSSPRRSPASTRARCRRTRGRQCASPAASDAARNARS